MTVTTSRHEIGPGKAGDQRIDEASFDAASALGANVWIEIEAFGSYTGPLALAGRDRQAIESGERQGTIVKVGPDVPPEYRLIGKRCHYHRYYRGQAGDNVTVACRDGSERFVCIVPYQNVLAAWEAA